jgi:hypothetical protein
MPLMGSFAEIRSKSPSYSDIWRFSRPVSDSGGWSAFGELFLPYRRDSLSLLGNSKGARGMRHQLALIGAGLASAVIFATAFPTSAVAQQHCTGPQIGTWKLQADEGHDVATGEKYEPLGAHPTGYITYGPDCRMQVVEIKDGRKAPANLVSTDAKRIALYNSFLAYAGTYSIKSDICRDLQHQE